MWNSISGQLTYKGSGIAYLQVDGLEWEFWTSSQSLNALPEVGSDAKIFTFLYHRDDQMRLYGFASKVERSLFLDLLRVDGVGPKLVIRILSGIDAVDLVQALETNDLVRLVQIPGLGNKTAQKMVLALQGKLSVPVHYNNTERELESDLVTALIGMGFSQKEAQKAVVAAINETMGISADKAVREQEILRRSVLRLGTSSSERGSGHYSNKRRNE